MTKKPFKPLNIAKQLKYDERDVFIEQAENDWYKEQMRQFENRLENTPEVRQGLVISELKKQLRNPFGLVIKIAKKLIKKVNQKWGGRTFFRQSLITSKSQLSISPKPVVSIVIPVYNLLSMTLKCLRSIAEAKEKVSFEVIVVDDASPDKRIKNSLSDIPGLKYIRRVKNGGFVESCNTGAKNVAGKYVYFLNNDTEVKDNWLSESLKLFKDKRVGLVGSKLIYPDGSLQEAGGVIFSDANGANFGNGDDPSKAPYNFIKEVDYCSGAGLMISKALFDELGGFSIEFAPGYYEDTDLCFKARRSGYRTMYQPKSVVVHYQGYTSKKVKVPNKKPMKQYQEINREKFRIKYQQELQNHYGPDESYRSLAAQRKKGLNIWVADSQIPTPDRDYGSARTIEVLKGLAQENSVTLLPFLMHDAPKYRDELGQYGIETFMRQSGFDLQNRLRLEGPKIDLVVLMRSDPTHHFFHLFKKYCKNARFVFDTHDIHHVRLSRELELEKDIVNKNKLKKEADYYREIELGYGRRADAVWAITSADKEQLEKLLPEQIIDVVSTAHEINLKVLGPEKRRDLFYVGSFMHPPNVSAMKYFINEIFPLIKQRIPTTKIHIVGQGVPAGLYALGDESVVFHGPVDDLQPFYDTSRVFVCPLQFGSGLKGKVVMAMSQGLPVVTTSIGAEGILARPAKEIDIADQEKDFADKVVRLIKDDHHWLTLSDASREFIKRAYGHDNLKNELTRAMDRVLHKSNNS